MRSKRVLQPTGNRINEVEYAAFLKEIKEKVRRARFEAFRAVNRTAIRVYWEIGQGIVERQKRLGWGKSIVSRLSEDLRRAFSEAEGFSTTNLWYMRQFFLTYQNSPNLQQSVVIMSKVKTEIKRKFYLEQTARQG